MTEAATVDAVEARRRHYGDFYGLDDPAITGRTALVVGNCQAESLRIMLQGPDVTLIRMPPVHELTAADLPALDRWLARADILVSQPVRDDYHDMPLGIRQLAARLGGSSVVPFPVIRFAGLYPLHAIVRPPRDASIVPPLVEYHDLSVLAEAAGSPLPALDVDRVRSIAALSIDELRRREVAHGAVPVSDLLGTPTFDMMRTLNHPGNRILTSLAERVRDRLGLATRAFDPGRPLLNGVHAPRSPVVIDAWGLDDEPTEHWVVGDRVVLSAEVRAAHLAWYRANPDVVAAGVARHAAALRLLAA